MLEVFVDASGAGHMTAGAPLWQRVWYRMNPANWLTTTQHLDTGQCLLDTPMGVGAKDHTHIAELDMNCTGAHAVRMLRIVLMSVLTLSCCSSRLQLPQASEV